MCIYAGVTEGEEMIPIGSFVRLKGKTLHGENRVREYGEKWRVDNISDVHYTPTPQTAYQLVSVDGARFNYRNVLVKNDQHFEVEEWVEKPLTIP